MWVETAGRYSGRFFWCPPRYAQRMSYVLPPNNAIAILVSDPSPAAEAARRAIFEVDLKLQLADRENTPEGSGPVRGWGGRSTRSR